MIVKSSHLAAIAVGLVIGGFAFGCMHSSEHAQADSAPAAVAPAPAAPVAAAQVDAARLVGADKDPGDWMTYGRTYSEQRFSPLAKINADNVKNLGLAWYSDLDTDRGQEATPVVVDGVMYITTAWSMVKAYDAKTGKPLWDFDPKVGREILIHVCCDAVNRGVAVWKGKVYVGTIDGRLIALDAATGKPVWSVQTTDRNKPYTITSAPRAFNDRIVIGNSGSEYGVRGYMSAYDAATGNLIWRTYTVPGDPSKGFESPAMKKAAKTWSGKWWEEGGGGSPWGGISYDPELDIMYFGTANGIEWDQKHRSPKGGDNLYLASIIALKGSTGEFVWAYQVVPGDVWDYDATQDVVLADLTIDGKLRKVAMQAGKDGFFYVLDRKTGELISANNFVPVNWAKGIDLKTGRPIEVAAARYDKTGREFTINPGPSGGHNWQPMAFNPQTSLVYIPAQAEPFPFESDKHFKPTTVGNNMAIDLGDITVAASATKKAMRSEKGFLLAWDPVHEKEVWRHQYAGPWNSGIMTTAGNLVFQGNATHEFAAFRADNGEKLWSAPTQTAVLAGAMTYEVDGEQYVATLVGWGGSYAILGGRLTSISGPQRNISRLLVFKLGATATLPPPAAQEIKVLDPPKQTASPAIIAEGKQLYGRNCVMCHGVDVISGGINPDLRYSKLLDDDGYYEVVLGGKFKDQGMVSFTKNINKQQATAIRAFIIERATEDKAEESKQAKN
jgi:alcohol dehydrogenase (cytochrome c)/quinohemoprotein ethanol dehydrogenase